MARLLRLHFSSIGHRDARLAPLTLDFRELSGGHHGTGADTVLWLRNGGGKSSVINLFYALFRTRAREFLGTSAEGKARRLEDYVKGRDLAFVVSEWDTDPIGDNASAPQSIRVVGTALAWKGQQRSTDKSKLRRLFFSLRTRPGALTFDTLPISGLAEPVLSYEAFREWLRVAAHEHAELEVTTTEAHNTWERHLERIGLDPELFRYQLAMNRREGAADEAFRFTTAADFIRFLLEMAFESNTADQLAKNLEAQRDSLRERPRFELERVFIAAALVELRPLALAVAKKNEALAVLERTLVDIASTITGVEVQSARFEEEAAGARTHAEAARQRATSAFNERDKKQRWARGLERLARELAVEEAEKAHEHALVKLRQLDLAEREHAAAALLRHSRELSAGLVALREALRRIEADIEPLYAAAVRHGTSLRLALGTEIDTLAARADHLRAQAERTRRRAHELRREGEQASEQRARHQQENVGIGQRIDRRERVREALVAAGAIEPREAAADALARLSARRAAGEAEAADHTARREALAAELADAREVTLTDERAKHEQDGQHHQRALDTALAWQDRLSEHPLILEVEGVDSAALEAPGLEDRLLSHAERARRDLIDSRLEGAEDDRALAALDADGLLPSGPDVERVATELRRAGVNAHPGLRYLAENVERERRRALLAADPSRFTGVIVIDEDGLERGRRASIAEPRSLVQVSRVSALEDGGRPSDAYVLGPDPAHFDHAEARARGDSLRAAREQRTRRERELRAREQAFTAVAGDLAKYLEAHGRGRLDALRERCEAARRQALAAARALEALAERRVTLEAAISEHRLAIARARELTAKLEALVLRVEGFIDEHERHIESLRRRRGELTGLTHQLTERIDAARIAEEAARRQLTEQEDHQRDLAASIRASNDERTAVAYFDAHLPVTAQPLEVAREAYAVARSQYEKEVSENKLKWQVEEKQRAFESAENQLRDAMHGLDEAAVDELAESDDLPGATREIARRLASQREAVGEAKARLEAARAALGDAVRRREADDLPSDRPRPETAAEARHIAEALTRESAQHTEDANVADAERAHFTKRAETIERDQRDQRALARALEDVVEHGATLSLPAAPAGVVPLETQALQNLTDKLKRRFSEERKAAGIAAAEAESRADAVRRVATEPRFEAMPGQHKERLRASDDSLFALSGSLSEGFEQRLIVVERQLAQYDEDRRVLVNEILQLTDQVSTLLRRATTASHLPAELGGWAGRSYLRVAFTFPERDDERRARLEPLVDRLVQGAVIPGGIDLVHLAAIELAGARGFNVSILKPDAVLRPETIPITAMNTFSRGQQLTAAILLYCTLVQLRARSRGRGSGRGAEDAGVLILDNPIGTCSSVPLLELQRTIARQMRVQLIYATGVEDVEALQTLPNKIRLRNTHRDRTSGDYHVTYEPDGDRGRVEAVRVIEVPPS